MVVHQQLCYDDISHDQSSNANEYYVINNQKIKYDEIWM